MEYALKMCRIETEFDNLDANIDKKVWLQEQIDQLEKEYLLDIKSIKQEFSFVYKQLMNLLNKEK